MTIKIEDVEDQHSKYKDNEIFKSLMLNYIEERTFTAIYSYTNANFAHFLNVQSIEKVSNCFIRCADVESTQFKNEKIT